MLHGKKPHTVWIDEHSARPEMFAWEPGEEGWCIPPRAVRAAIAAGLSLFICALVVIAALAKWAS